MIVRRGQLIEVRHSRKGRFTGRADKDFNTEVDEFYPVRLAGNTVNGITVDWHKGELIPCRNILCKVTLLECNSDD